MQSEKDLVEAIRLSFVRETKVVEFRQVRFEKWRPKVAQCHQNVEFWVANNPSLFVVRGWVHYMPNHLTAHSVVRDGSGALFDITPVENEAVRQTMLFITHPGDEESFQRLRKTQHNILRFEYCS